METIYNDLLSRLGKKTCGHHHQKPYVNFTNNKLTLLCCCNEFKVKCYRDIVDMLMAYKKRQALHVVS